MEFFPGTLPFIMYLQTYRHDNWLYLYVFSLGFEGYSINAVKQILENKKPREKCP